MIRSLYNARFWKSAKKTAFCCANCAASGATSAACASISLRSTARLRAKPRLPRCSFCPTRRRRRMSLLRSGSPKKVTPYLCPITEASGKTARSTPFIPKRFRTPITVRRAGVWILQTIPPKKRAGTSGSPSRATAACTCVPLRPRGRSG